MAAEQTNKCRDCNEEFTELNPKYCKGKHRKCYMKIYDKVKRFAANPREPRLDNCQICSKKFDENNLNFCKNMCERCYYRNRAKVRGATKGIYNTKTSNQTVVNYQFRRYDNSPQDRQIDEMWTEKSLPQLKQFQDRVNRNSGIVNLVDCYIMVHLFETYYPKATTFLDTYPVEKQLKFMWNYIKTL